MYACNGHVRTFQRINGAWVADATTLTKPIGGGPITNNFGLHSSLDGDRLLVSSPQEPLLNGLSPYQYQHTTFAAYLYERQGNAWTFQQILTPPVPAGGIKAMISGGTALLPTSTLTPPYTFTNYLFALTDTACPISADGVCCDTPCGYSNPFDCQACSVAAGAAVDGVCGPVVAGQVCQPLTDGCLQPQTCDGVALECPVPPVGGACSDGDACSVGDTCDDSYYCDAGAPVLCDDQNPCTDESCDEALGCVSEPRANGEPCTLGCASATCQAGQCQVPPDAETCADGDACTADLCEADTCVNVPLEEGAPCFLDDLCVVNTTCDAQGQCQGGSPLDCNDEAECTEDGCDAAEGCAHTPKPDGTPCSLGECEGGECVPTGAGGQGGSNEGAGGANGEGGVVNEGDAGSDDEGPSGCSEDRSGRNSCELKCSCNLGAAESNMHLGYLAVLAMALAGVRRSMRR